MIIKKPYAFLIKNFRIIHGILFGMLLYLFINSMSIYSFFSSYASNGYYTMQNNLADNYISFMMFIACILVMIVSAIIYYLLELKDKNNKIYMFIALYGFILFVYFIYYNSVFNGLEDAVLNTESVRALRDISLIAVLPQVVFLFTIAGRTLGFNLKQFDFKRDLEELSIDKSDSEEIEVTLTDNTYKVKRFFRKLLRLTKYFFLENKMFVIGVSSIIVIVLGIVVIKKINIYTDAYKEQQELIAHSLWFNVNESYITKYDGSNNLIVDGKSFVIVNINVSNKSDADYDLDSNLFKLKIGEELISSNVSYSNKFNDLGKIYSSGKIHSGEDTTYNVIFEIDDVNVKEEYVFKIKDLISASSGIVYKDIIIKPINLDNSKDAGTYTLPNEIKFNDSILKNSSLIVSSYEISDMFKENYTYNTSDGKTHNATYTIIPNNVNRSETKIIRFKASTNIDSSSYSGKYIKNASDLLYYYGIIRYRYLGNYKETKLSKMSLGFESKDYIYMEISKEVGLANKIDLILLIRGIKYTINLK